MSNLPKFDFSKSTIKTTDALTAKMKETGEQDNPYFRPGSYELQVEAVECQGPAKDSNWYKFLLKFKGVADKRINLQLFVPTSTLLYKTASGEESLVMFKKYAKVMDAFGTPVTPENVGEVTTKFFGNLKSLVGLRVQAEIGYKGNYLRYEGKDEEAGTGRIVIALKTGATVNNDVGEPLVFSSYTAAAEYAQQKGIEVSRFTDVLSLSRSTTKPKAVSNW